MLVGPGDQPAQDRNQRFGGALELDHLACQIVRAASDAGVAAEDFRLDLVDVVFQSAHDRLVVVDHPVQDGIEDRLGAAAQDVGLGLHAAAHPVRSGPSP